MFSSGSSLSNAALSPPAKMSAQHGSSSMARGSRPQLDAMRAYRACINCRNRKTRCDLDANNGRPPCRRCQREQRECILGESHRGGRRVRKKPKLEDEKKTPPVPSPQSLYSRPPSDLQKNVSFQAPQRVHDGFMSRDDHTLLWQERIQGSPLGRSPSLARRDSDTSSFMRRDSREHTESHSPYSGPYRPRAQSVPTSNGPVNPTHQGIASADLQNPSDALEILAQVADRESPSTTEKKKTLKSVNEQSDFGTSLSPDIGEFSYRPLEEGIITTQTIFHLFASFERDYHPFFPIPPRSTFDQQRLPRLSRTEPHLFSAILTIASQEDDRVHQACHDHMQQLVSGIVSGADANVEAVEALLLLSHWVSHRPQAHVTVGRGEEDRQAWMYIGTAVRLGFFLGIDRTAFKTDLQKDHPLFVRNKLAWVACYVCDRSVAVRLGKGFWARGPGPLSGLRAPDFLSLQPLGSGDDNWAAIFQANLELTQIFSNVHDILYSSKGHGWKDMLEGRYAKYLDDFRTSIRTWHDTWGTLECSHRLKASLLLSYDYLRLYVNAFAYQATISRAMANSLDSQDPNQNRVMITAAAPDARFIYEALDAAKSLLSTFNSFVAPETLRYMPSHYYLYIIYSAVFLYKARLTTTMAEEERTGLRSIINQTIERLQKSSVGANNMGTRYSRLLQLLWRKAPRKNGINGESGTPTSLTHQSVRNGNGNGNGNGNMLQDNTLQSTTHFDHSHSSTYGPGVSLPPLSETDQMFNGGPSASGTFSWLDLGAAWSFATQNNSISGGSAGELELEEQMIGDSSGMSPFDMGLLTDYRLLNEDNPNLIF